MTRRRLGLGTASAWHLAGRSCAAGQGRRILALDGCVLRCAAACLARAGVTADNHLVLSDYGVKKRKHADFAPVEARRVYGQHALPAARALRAVLQVPEGGDADVV